MLFDQVDGSLGADSLDGATVVAAKQNTKVYELRQQKGEEGNAAKKLHCSCTQYMVTDTLKTMKVFLEVKHRWKMTHLIISCAYKV